MRAAVRKSAGRKILRKLFSGILVERFELLEIVIAKRTRTHASVIQLLGRILQNQLISGMHDHERDELWEFIDVVYW